MSTAHFARMFRQSTSETPHQFALRQWPQRANAMLRAPDARVLDVAVAVAVACGFKTRQQFALVFRVCGITPTGHRQDFWATRRLARRKPDPKIRPVR
jgi:AraC family transcriptional regulator